MSEEVEEEGTRDEQQKDEEEGDVLMREANVGGAEGETGCD